METTSSYQPQQKHPLLRLPHPCCLSFILHLRFLRQRQLLLAKTPLMEKKRTRTSRTKRKRHLRLPRKAQRSLHAQQPRCKTRTMPSPTPHKPLISRNSHQPTLGEVPPSLPSPKKRAQKKKKKKKSLKMRKLQCRSAQLRITNTREKPPSWKTP
jgi:hypothetical protein